MKNIQDYKDMVYAEALLVLDGDGITAAMSTVQSRMREHPDLSGFIGLTLGMQKLANGQLNTSDKFKTWLEAITCNGEFKQDSYE